MTRPIRPTRPRFEASLLQGASFQLPLGHGTLKGRDLGSLKGLLAYACEIANQTLIRTDRTVQLSELLAAAVDGHPDLVSPSEKHFADISAQLKEITQPSLRRDPSGEICWDVDVGPNGAHVLLTALLMVPEYRGLIRRCPQCGKFLVREGKRLFCGPECYRVMNGANASDRKRKERLREAAQKLLPYVASVAKRVAAIKQALRNHPEVPTPEALAEHARALLQPSRKHK